MPSGRPMRTGRPKIRAASSGKSGELAGAAGEDHAAARLGRERRRGEPVTHHFEDFLDARLDDVHERRAGDELRRCRAHPRRPAAT